MKRKCGVFLPLSSSNLCVCACVGECDEAWVSSVKVWLFCADWFSPDTGSWLCFTWHTHTDTHSNRHTLVFIRTYKFSKKMRDRNYLGLFLHDTTVGIRDAKKGNSQIAASPPEVDTCLPFFVDPCKIMSNCLFLF